jgi:ParB-like chromosome segregation protein Spo0J
VIDGQQRLLATKELGIKELPCLIIPEKYALNLMELNVEKTDVLKRKSISL